MPENSLLFMIAMIWKSWLTKNLTAPYGAQLLRGYMATINYKGQELECIESGYWPEGVTLVVCDVIGVSILIANNVICLHNGIAFYSDGSSSSHWIYWAILPPKPAPRRLTNREAFELCKKGWDVLYKGDVARYFIYPLILENEVACDYCEKLRAPGSDEWVDPTSDLLEGVE